MCSRAIPSLFFCLVVQAVGGGVMVFKDFNHQNDAQAKPLPYSKVEPMGAITWFTTSGGRVGMEANKFCKWVEIPLALSGTVVEPARIVAHTDKLVEVREFSARFPQAAPFLAAAVTRIAGEVEEFQKGNVLVEGAWTKRADYDRMVRQQIEAKERERIAKAEAELARKRAEDERKRAEDERRRVEMERAQKEFDKKIEAELMQLDARLSETTEKIERMKKERAAIVGEIKNIIESAP